jgi:hypothetical protein
VFRKDVGHEFFELFERGGLIDEELAGIEELEEKGDAPFGPLLRRICSRRRNILVYYCNAISLRSP